MIRLAKRGLIITLALSLTACPDFLASRNDDVAPPLVFGFPGPLEYDRYLATVDDTFNVTVFYPVSDDPIVDAPVVVFNVGWNAIRPTYESYCVQLAQWGYVCVIRYWPSLGILGFGDNLYDDHLAHCLRTIDWVAEQNVNADSPIFGMADADNVGLIGHSLGGSVALAATPLNPSVRATISLDAIYDIDGPSRVFNFADTDAAILYLAAELGAHCSQAPGADLNLFEATFPPKELVTILGADHMDFMEDPPQSPDSQDVGEPICSVGTIESSEVRILAHRYLISWFNVHLKGLTEFETYYLGEEAQADVAAGRVTIDSRL